MPVNQGPAPAHSFDNTNGQVRKELRNDLLDKITDIASLKREADSIALSDNLHLDVRPMTTGDYSGSYKVDVQYRKGTKGAIAQIMLHPNATSLADAKTGLNNSVGDGRIWIVT